MSGILFKYASSTALQAALRLTAPASNGGEQAPAQPDARDAENLALREEIERLGGQLQALRGEWHEKLAAAKASAKLEAAREHIRDDARHIEALESVLRAASEQFADALSDQVTPLATALAVRAVDRLVALSADEAEWLGRVVARRLEDIAAESVIAIHLASQSHGDAIERLLASHIARGIPIKHDPALPTGTAKIVLALGEIEVAPAEGAAALIGLLERAADGND